MKKLEKLFQAKRILALFLAVVLTVPTMPMSVYAAPEESTTVVEETEVINESEEASVEEISSVEVEAEVESEVGTDVYEGEAASSSEETPEAKSVYAIEDHLNDDAKVKEYTGSAVFNLNASQYTDGIVITKDGEDYSSVFDVEGYSYKWQAQKDGAYADMAEDAAPVNAGKYKLVVTVPAVADAYDEMTKEIEFEITKASLSISWEVYPTEPGAKVSDIQLSSLEAIDNADNEFRYIADDASTTEVNENAESQLSYTIKVVDAIDTEKEYTADSIIATNVDYVIEITPAFTDKVSAEVQANYEALYTVKDVLHVEDLIDTEISVTLAEKWAEEGVISKTYTESAIVLDETDYTAKVQYENGIDKETGDTVYADIADAEITVSWKDIDGDNLESAPVDAGTYYCVLSYAGKAGIYSACSKSLVVEINRAAITVRPVISESFFAGTTAYDVLSKVSYDVYKASDEKMTIDKATFWGTYLYDSSDTTLAYEPVFALQESYDTGNTDEEDNPVIAYATMDEDEVLEKGKTYRIIFTGEKEIYYEDGDVYYSYSINETDLDTEEVMDPNYTVTVDAETLEKYAAPVTVAEGKLATISVDALIDSTTQAGSTYENPITKVYDEKALFDTREQYKTAVVTAPGVADPIAQKTDKTLTYTWYYQSGTTTQLNEETGQYDTVPVWRNTTYYKAPVNAGNYMLEVSYQHEKNEYVAEPVYVYYQIDKQKVKIVPTGEYSALTETYVEEFLYFTDITYDIFAVAEDGNDVKLDWSDDDYYIYWTVERQSDAENDIWVDAYDEKFEKDQKYRLAVDELELDTYELRNNYVNYEIVTEGEGEDAVSKTVYLNETADITLKVMGSTELAVAVSEPITIEKIYDGVAIDISNEIAEGKIKLVTKEDQKEVTDTSVYALWYDTDNDEFVDEPVNAGNYTLYIYFEGDETYHALGLVELENVTAKITPAEVTITPVVKEEIVAGKSVPYIRKETIFEGVAEVDKDAFTYQLRYNEISHSYYYNWGAFDNNDLTFTVTDEDGSAVSNGVYAGGKEYTVTATLEELDLEYPYSRNYTFKENTAKFKTVRGNSTVTGIDPTIGDTFIISDKIDGFDHLITPEEGIPYFSGSIDDGFTDGNYLVLMITAPEEYSSIPASAVYENQIEAAGGWIITTISNSILVVFDASLYDQKKFSIRWEEGYIENFTVDFSKASLLDDLEEAQAPKTLSFNSPDKKMAVGDEQQLDVKLTKVLESDTISLKYESSNTDVLCVDSDGWVTALAEGTATITVSSVREVNGEIVDTTPAKKASVTITVSKVSAPKITKVSPWDIDTYVSFTTAQDGWRREVYVLEGKNRTAVEFEEAIASMVNQKWEGIFATEPNYTSSYNATVYLDGLEHNTEYTVYVRNVSGAGYFCYAHYYGDKSHDCVVTESIAGSVKSFKTTKLQVRRLEAYFNDNVTTYDDDMDTYTVKLSSKKTKVSVMGYFPDAADYADKTDYLPLPLPLTKGQQNDYVNPKLKYYVGTISYAKTKDTIFNMGGAYLNKTSLASVNAKGQISLKGVGEVCVVAYDTVRMCYGYTTLNITASADSITGKTVKLQPGQRIELADLLTYKEGKKVLTGDYDTYVIVDDALKKAFEDSDEFDLIGTTVVAVKSGGSLQVTLSDAYVGADKTAVARLQSVAVEPVKKLKTASVVDQAAVMEFTYSGYAKGFRIQVTDGRGDLMKDVQIAKEELYDSSTGKYYYLIAGLTQKSKYNVTITAVYGDESAKEESKAAKKSFKTTAIPASYVSLPKDEYNEGVAIQILQQSRSSYIEDAYMVAGNTYTFNVTDGNDNLNLGAKYSQSDTLTWTSSNKKVATVKANKDTFTATLKALKSGWTTIEVKSKITKAVIARYKIYIRAVGNGDSYYGSNEPLPESIIGEPFLDKPDYTREEIVDDSENTYTYQAVTLNQVNYVSLGYGEYAWYSFTAPSSGTYRFKASEGEDSDIWIFSDLAKASSVYAGATSSDLRGACKVYNDGYYDTGYSFNTTYPLSAGQTIYFAVGDYGLNNEIDFSFTVTRE